MVQVAWLLWVAGTHALMAVVKEGWAGGGAQVQYAVSTTCQLELSVMHLVLCDHCSLWSACPDLGKLTHFANHREATDQSCSRCGY